MRADRLISALLLLQARGRITAAELARELEISVATARRDLEALSSAGIPVYPQPGRGGGWSLVGGARTDLSGLTADESRALFLLLGPASSASPGGSASSDGSASPGGSDGPGGREVPAVASALRKLIRALPATFRPDAEAAARAVVADPAGWGELASAGAGQQTSDLVRTLQDAVVRRLRVRLTYARKAGAGKAGTGRAAERLVDPLGLVDKDGAWYLIADTESGRRTFRIDRIAAEVTDQPARRPEDFDLATEWARVVDDMERRRSLVSAVVLTDARFLPVLRSHFGRHCELLARDGDRVRVRVAAHLTRSIAEQLAGWGNLVEVVEPAAVRTELARIGRELLDRYAPPPPEREMTR